METAYKTFFRLLDFIFPRTELTKKLEDMSSATFSETAKKSLPLEFGIKAYYEYRDPLARQAVWCLKYQANKRITLLIAQIIHSELVEELSDLAQFQNFTDPLLIPVPLSTKRKRERGFNQTELLGNALHKIDPSLFEYRTDIVLKIKHTLPQTLSLSRSKRIENLKGCFKIRRPKHIKGRNIIVLDDVTTTGSTFREMKSALRKAGARKVIGRAFAH